MSLDKQNTQGKAAYMLNPIDKGINTDTAISVKGELLDCNNIVFTNRGGITKRNGCQITFVGKPADPYLSLQSSDAKMTGILELDNNGTLYRYMFVGTSIYYLTEDTTPTEYPLEFSDVAVAYDVWTKNKRPVTASMNDRGIVVSGEKNMIVLDGTHAFKAGLPKPTTTAVEQSTAAVGGSMSDGEYKFAYAFYRSSNDFHGVISDPVTVTLAGATDTQKVTIRCQTEGLITTSYSFDNTDIDVANDRVTLTAHGLSIGAYMNLLYTEGTAVIPGFTDGDEKQWTVVDANTLQCINGTITGAGAGTGHTLSHVKHKADKVYLFRTKDEGVTYYKVADASCGDMDAGYDSDVDVEATISDNSILGANIYDDDHYEPPEDVNYIFAKDNRLWAFDGTYCYYSEINNPEIFPLGNVVKTKPGVTGVNEILNYLVICTGSNTYLMDSSYPSRAVPQIISNNIGCDSHWTMQSVANGQLTMWLSSEGFVATNGVEVLNISQDKINEQLIEDRDFPNAVNAMSAYIPQVKRYMCYVPYIGNDQMWVIDFSGGGKGAFVKHSYNSNIVIQFLGTYLDTDNRPMAMAGYFDERPIMFDLCVLHANTYTNSKEVCVDTYWVVIIDAFMGIVTAPISMSFKTRFDDMGDLTRDKNIKYISFRWRCDKPGVPTSPSSTATVYLGTDDRDRHDSNTALHGGVDAGKYDRGLMESFIPFEDGLIGRTISMEFTETSTNRIVIGEVVYLFTWGGVEPERYEN